MVHLLERHLYNILVGIPTHVFLQFTIDYSKMLHISYIHVCSRMFLLKGMVNASNKH